MKTKAKEKLEEQFIYPKHPLLKQAYQGVICKVFHEKRITFQPIELILAILDRLSWEDDSNIDVPDRKPGFRYKRAKNILKSFEGSFTKFSGSGLEIFIFKPDKGRVSSFKELESLCAADIDMSELIATTEKFDLTQPWQDALVLNPTYPISSELAEIDIQNNKKKDDIVKTRKRNKQHKGIVKGDKLQVDPFNIPNNIGDQDLTGLSEVGFDDRI